MSEAIQPIYGYGVICEIRNLKTQEVETKTFRSKGKSRSKAERSVIFRNGFVRIVELDPYTHDQWKRVFGEGRM